MKNRSFRTRLGFAAAGIRTVWQREKSFRTQCLLALGAAAAVAVLQPGWLWAAIIALIVALILALEMINAALEYLIDHLHPAIAEEIKCAKDAAAGAVLIASMVSLCIAAMLIFAEFGQ